MPIQTLSWTWPWHGWALMVCWGGQIDRQECVTSALRLGGEQGNFSMPLFCVCQNNQMEELGLTWSRREYGFSPRKFVQEWPSTAKGNSGAVVSTRYSGKAYKKKFCSSADLCRPLLFFPISLSKLVSQTTSFPPSVMHSYFLITLFSFLHRSPSSPLFFLNWEIKPADSVQDMIVPKIHTET